MPDMREYTFVWEKIRYCGECPFGRKYAINATEINCLLSHWAYSVDYVGVPDNCPMCKEDTDDA
jgi:hypothetical protein